MSERDRMHLVITFTDVLVAEEVFVPVPEGGTVTKITGSIGLAITGDLGITFEIGGVAVTGSALTFTAAGSAPGDIEESTPTALNIIPRNGSLECIFDGVPSVGEGACLHIEIERNVA